MPKKNSSKHKPTPLSAPDEKRENRENAQSVQIADKSISPDEKKKIEKDITELRNHANKLATYAYKMNDDLQDAVLKSNIAIKATQTFDHQLMDLRKENLKFQDWFEDDGQRLSKLENLVKIYGKTGTNMTRWQLEFKNGMKDEINEKLEELIAAKDERPGVWRKMANVLHRENKNKDLEKMQNNMKNMQEEVDDLKRDISWLQTTNITEKVNEYEEKMKEVSLSDDPKKGEVAIESYPNARPEEGSEEDKNLKKNEADANEREAHVPRKQDPSYQAEIKNRYIV